MVDVEVVGVVPCLVGEDHLLDLQVVGVSSPLVEDQEVQVLLQMEEGLEEVGALHAHVVPFQA